MKTLTSLLLASALVAAPIATSYAHQHTDKSDMPMMDGQMIFALQQVLLEQEDSVKQNLEQQRYKPLYLFHVLQLLR